MRTTNRKAEKNKEIFFDPNISQKTYEEYQKKLIKLKKEIRPKLSDEVARLALLGDFSENFEYQNAKSKLRGINNKILEIENMLNKAQIIEENLENDFITLGKTVKLKINDEIKTYKILGSQESNPNENIISQNSPLGEKLLGKKLGDKIEIKLKDKENIYEIIEIK
jgi:transcription elongation factor GreA